MNPEHNVLSPPFYEEAELTIFVFPRGPVPPEDVDEDEQEAFIREAEKEDFLSEYEFISKDEFISEDEFNMLAIQDPIRGIQRWKDLPQWVIFMVMKVDEWREECQYDGKRKYILTLEAKGKTCRVWAPTNLNNWEGMEGKYIRFGDGFWC